VSFESWQKDAVFVEARMEADKTIPYSWTVMTECSLFENSLQPWLHRGVTYFSFCGPCGKFSGWI